MILLVSSLGSAALGIYALSAWAQEKPVQRVHAVGAFVDAPAGKETLDFDGRFNQIEAAVLVLSNRLGRMVQQPTQNNSVEKRLADLERQVALLERQMDALQRRLQRVELKK